MRCVNCHHNNPAGSNFCCRCGSELRHARLLNKALRKNGEAPLHDKKSRLAIAGITAALLLLIFGLTAVALHSIRNNNSKHDAEANSHLEETAAAPSPTPTLPPVNIVKPTPRPTPTPSPEPMRTPMPPQYLKRPRLKVQSSAEPTEAYTEDLEPIGALCSFILYGDAKYARQAFPPEFITYTISSYGFAAQLLGSEDAVIKYAGDMLLASFSSNYGEIYSINYSLVTRHRLSTQELRELRSGLGNYGMTTMPEKANQLTIDLIITSENGVFREQVVPHVLLIDGCWYIDPEDIDF